MEQIYTIPVNEAFEASAADASCGCPLCTLYRKLEENELELILGASMMEPDVRIQTNREGFCRLHYDMMFVRKNRLGMALTLESHLKELKDEGVWIFGTAADGDRTIYEADLKGPAAIVIGSEGEGMGRLVAETCDFKVRIPMKGKLNSLNASAAAAILLYEAVRQRMG